MCRVVQTHRPTSGCPAVLTAAHPCKNRRTGFSICVKASGTTPWTEQDFKDLFFLHEASLKYNAPQVRCFLKALLLFEGAGQEQQLSSTAASPHGPALALAGPCRALTSSQEHRLPCPQMDSKRGRAGMGQSKPEPSGPLPGLREGRDGGGLFWELWLLFLVLAMGSCVHRLCLSSCWCCAGLVAGSKLVEKVGKDRKCGILLFSTNTMYGE